MLAILEILKGSKLLDLRNNETDDTRKEADQGNRENIKEIF